MKSKEKEIVESVLADFKNRQAMRKSFETNWQININFLFGNQYCNIGYGGVVEEAEKQYFWQEREVFNHLAPIYDVRCAKLAQAKPKFSVVPATNDERDKQTSKLAKKILNSVMNKLSVQDKVDEAIKWSEACGTVFYKVVWNSKLGQLLATNDDGSEVRSGEVEVSVCSPFEIYPDSNTCSSLEECQSLIHAKVYSVDEIESMYGVKLEGKTMNCYGLNSVVNGIGGLGYNATTTKLSENRIENSQLVIEKYIRPNKGYPNGRLIIVAGDKLVYDDDLPYVCEEEGKRGLPFIRQSSISRPGCFWANSVIERLVPVQRAYNAVKNRKHEFINRLTLGVLSVEDGSVDIDNLEDEGLCPGKILVYRQGANAPEYLSGEAIPTGFADEEEKLLNEFWNISGVSEFGTNYLNSNLSGVALELIINQDEARLNTSINSIKSSFVEIAKRILRLYKQFAVFPRLTRIVGERGQVELFYFSSSDISSDDVVVEAQADLGDSLLQKREMVFNLLSAGLLNDENGNLSASMKAKVLEMLGLGVWENAQDINELHIKSADNENLKMLDGVNVKVREIDNHELHLNEHIAFMLGNDFEQKRSKNPKLEELFMEHINMHKKMQKGE